MEFKSLEEDLAHTTALVKLVMTIFIILTWRKRGIKNGL